jgi:hypothetical protein
MKYEYHEKKQTGEVSAASTSVLTLFNNSIPYVNYDEIGLSCFVFSTKIDRDRPTLYSFIEANS